MNTSTGLAAQSRTGIEAILDGRRNAVTSSPKRALLAEDNAVLRALISRAMTGAGLSVRECSTGLELAEALDDALTHVDQYPDVVVTDICMPGYTGLEVLDALRELNDRIPVILMTGLADHDVETEAKRLRAFAVLYKPLNVDELTQTIRACLAPAAYRFPSPDRAAGIAPTRTFSLADAFATRIDAVERARGPKIAQAN